jgi:opacity protein-like surface antigen
MRKLLFVSLFCFSCYLSFSQVHIGVFGGIGNYEGDLINSVYVGKLTRVAVGVTGEYELSNKLSLRAGFTFAQIAGDDQYNSKEYLKLRNINFESNIAEFSLVAQYYTFGFDNRRWSPYVFGGLAVYHFNPYILTTNDEKIFLKPLSTEGQGLAAYPESKPYSLTQLALPFGAGVKYALNDNIRIGAEIGLRKLFTDYLDDISTNYADENDLRAERGDLAVQVAYRGDEVAGGNPNYPAKGAQRGGVDQKDWYYLTGLTVSFRLGNGGGGLFGGGGKGKYGCPKVPM